MATLLRSLLMTIGIAVFVTIPMAAQSPAPSAPDSAVVGTVTDVNGSAVEGATVVLKGAFSSESDTVVTAGNGFFDFESLKPGTYQVTVHAKGFADWTSPDLSLQAGEYKIVNECKLRIDQARTTVDVNYSPVEVATEQFAIAEKQRVLGIVPNFYVVYDPDPAPLTTKLKFRLALRVPRDPVTAVGIGFLADAKQAGNTLDYEQGAADSGSGLELRLPTVSRTL